MVANLSDKGEEKNGLAKRLPAPSKGWGITLALLSFFVALSLLDYDPGNFHTFPPIGEAPLLGKLGVILGRTLFAHLGVTAWLMPWFFLFSSWLCFAGNTKKGKLLKLAPLLILMLSTSLIANLVDHASMQDSGTLRFDQSFYEHGAGGSIGAWMYSGLPVAPTGVETKAGWLRIWFGEAGTWMLALFLLFGSLAYHLSFRFSRMSGLIELIWKLASRKSAPESADGNTVLESSSPFASRRKQDDPKESVKSFFAFMKFKKIEETDPLFGDVSLQDQQFADFKLGKKGANRSDRKREIPISDSNENNPKPETEEELSPDSETHLEILEKDFQEEETSLKEATLDGFKVVRPEKTEKSNNLFPERKGDYHFPTLDLLMEPPEESSGGDEDHMIKARRLKETLAEFKIDVELGEVHTGPVITRYDIHPAAGVRVEKIANLDKNLAMALRAESVRILAPVPGKGCVGVEVPNEKAAPVCLKEILESKAWADAKAEIPIVLGKEASGRPLVADLTKMPHLLVAGSTGSGKTVCINAIIASLCYHSSPEDVRFIMVDPKIVEMKIYNDLPHMLIPVVTDPKKVPGALKWLLVEMERRYQIFSKVGVRNIAGFNAKILKDKEEKEKAQLLDAEMTAEERAALSSVQVPRDDSVLEIPENKLPYVVCIIDELADLMMVAQADVETGIARLAQLARAAGIHLIIATQRPSVNVITGVIKANLPSRISFRVASYRDSQTILDGKGAESLIGKGDMLFIPPGSATFMRAQGAFVSDEEINGIVEYLKINGPPEIIEEVREQVESAGMDEVLGVEDDEKNEDPMIRKAIEIIRSTKRASTSNLQRKLSIGYNRAARIMDELEERGIVGPDLPGQGRDILIDL